MPCDICDHTLENVGAASQTGRRVFWCPRCGTLHTVAGERHEETDHPKAIGHTLALLMALKHGGRIPPSLIANVAEAIGFKDMVDSCESTLSKEPSAG